MMAKPTQGSWKRLKKAGRYLTGVEKETWVMRSWSNNSSAKEVHRGRQQKRISRQPLQSSSSSAAAAAAAVAAAGTERAEAAWRGLDRVRELCVVFALDSQLGSHKKSGHHFIGQPDDV